MKNKIRIKIRSVLLIAVVLTLSINSCKENSVLEPETVEENRYGKYSNNIIVKDESGLNSITLTIFAHDKSLLDNYLKHEFELVNPEISYTEVLEDSIETSELDENLVDFDVKKVVTVMVSETNLDDDYKSGYRLSIITHEDDARGWSYSLFSSKQTGAQKWSLTRNTGWHNVYLNWSKYYECFSGCNTAMGYKVGGKITNGQTTCREYDSQSYFAYWEVQVQHKANRHITFTWTQFASFPENCDIPFN